MFGHFLGNNANKQITLRPFTKLNRKIRRLNVQQATRVNFECLSTRKWLREHLPSRKVGQTSSLISVWSGGISYHLVHELILRKTGLMIKDTGRRDSAGLEDMDAFFSPAVEKSPKKTALSPAKRLSFRAKIQTTHSDDSVPMSGTSSTLLYPIRLNKRFN
jgi:hypothetical protein